MPGIGSTGCYVDDKGNEWAAQIVGRSFEVDPDGKKIETGQFEVLGTFRDGTHHLFSKVPPDQLLEPETSEEPGIRVPIADRPTSSDE